LSFLNAASVNDLGRKTVQDGTNGQLIASANSQIAQSGYEIVVEVGEDHQSDGHSGVNHLHVGVTHVRREVPGTTQSTAEEGDQVVGESVVGGGVGGEVDGTWGLLAVEEGEDDGIFEFLLDDGGDGGNHKLNLRDTQSGSVFGANSSGVHNLRRKTLKDDSDDGTVSAADSERLKSPDEDSVESIENISVDGHVPVHLHHVGVTLVGREVGVGTSQSSTEISDEISSEPVELERVVQKVDRTRR